MCGTSSHPTPTAVQPCSLALAALPVKQVSVERLFSAIRLLLSDLRVEGVVYDHGEEMVTMRVFSETGE